MRIAQVVPPFQSVPPIGYGGTERVVHTLVEELVRRGHEVTLFAPGDSACSARLVPTVPRGLWREPPGWDAEPYFALTLARAYGAAAEGRFDVVHAHLDYRAFACARLCPTPTITTMHGRLDLPGLPAVFAECADAAVVSISDAQRARLPLAGWVATVHNGVPLECYEPSYEPGRYLAFLGRISPDKGLDKAIEVARRAGMPLKVMARMPLPDRRDPEVARDWRYYEEVIEPLLREPFVEYLGEGGDAAKADLLRGAAALLFPIDWPEPFGLVLAEALACGTPVVATPRGSVPEVVVDGVTGFVRATVDELAAACLELDAIDRRACRADAERRFSAAAMADGYEKAYAAVAAAPELV